MYGNLVVKHNINKRCGLNIDQPIQQFTKKLFWSQHMSAWIQKDPINHILENNENILDWPLSWHIRKVKLPRYQKESTKIITCE